jgi:hypothetical protein
MNQPDSSGEKLMRKRTHGSDNGDTSSMELEHDFIGTSADCIRSDDDDSDDDDFRM